MKKEIKPHLDTCLVSYPDEEWRDVIGYDGMYSVSNYGRVKSETRYTSNGKLIKERILKQWCSKLNECSVILSNGNIKKTHRIMKTVGMAFLGPEKEGYVYCHKNKIKTDNRLCNISYVPYSESCELDYKLGVKTDWGVSSVMLDNVKDYLDKYAIYEDGVLVRKICNCCHNELPINSFYQRENGNYRRECKECLLIKDGVKEIGKVEQRKELAKNGLRYCSICKDLKNLDTDFNNSKTGYLGKGNTCKKCVSNFNLKYREKNKKTITI